MIKKVSAKKEPVKKAPAKKAGKSPLRQELTVSGQKSRKLTTKGGKSVGIGKSGTMGIDVDPKTGVATAQAVKKKFIGGTKTGTSADQKIPHGTNQKARITNSGGSIIKEADLSTDANAKLYRQYQKDSTYEARGNANKARLFNITTGKAKNLTADEIARKQRAGFFRK